MKTILLISLLILGGNYKLLGQDLIEIHKNSTVNKDSVKMQEREKFDFLFTNAINFDFKNTSKSSLGYFGHINYFFNVNKGESEESNFYVNTGFVKANYYSPDLNKGSFYKIDNNLESPLSPTSPGNPYIIEYNRYDYDVELKTLSGYGQLLYKVSKNQPLFVHLHGELLITDIRTQITVTTEATEEGIIPNQDLFPVGYINKEYSFSVQNLGAYFGLGGTFKKAIGNENKFLYYIQGTAGLSVTKLNPKLTPWTTGETPTYQKTNGGEGFFLIHSYILNEISDVNIILGGQIRGNYKNPPLYMFYVGLNTDLQNLRNLF